MNQGSVRDHRERPSFLNGSAPRVGLTKADAAYVEIRSRILACDLMPGSSIDQEMFASWLGSSTTPIREALRRLEAEQLVVLRAHSEVKVAPASVEEFREFHTIRLGLEPLAASIAAKQITKEDLGVLRDLIAGATLPDGALQGSRAFHRVIYAAAGNVTMTQILDSIWDRVSRYRVMLAGVGSASSCDSPVHRGLLAALEAGEAEETRRIMVDDLEESFQHLSPDLEVALEKYR